MSDILSTRKTSGDKKFTFNEVSPKEMREDEIVNGRNEND